MNWVVSPAAGVAGITLGVSPVAGVTGVWATIRNRESAVAAGGILSEADTFAGRPGDGTGDAGERRAETVIESAPVTAGSTIGLDDAAAEVGVDRAGSA